MLLALSLFLFWQSAAPKYDWVLGKSVTFEIAPGKVRTFDFKHAIESKKEEMQRFKVEVESDRPVSFAVFGYRRNPVNPSELQPTSVPKCVADLVLTDSETC